MRLLEAIIQANHRAVAGDPKAGLRPAEFADALPLVALTCIDPRLNPLMPEVLGISEEDFIWLRNAGNIITGPMSSTMRSLALACAIKGGKEIAVIGHTDCRVRQTTVLQLTERFRALGIERGQLPENVNEFFGLFASERQNVIKACEFVRTSPLIGPAVPVHGLLVDIESGRLEWPVNGYQTVGQGTVASSALSLANSGPVLADFKMEDLHWPGTRIGEVSSHGYEQPPTHVESAPPIPPPVPPSVSRPKPKPAHPPPLRIKR